MTDSPVRILAQTLIALAWSDGTLGEDERAGLRDLIFRIPGLSGDEWALLSAEIEQRVEESERVRRIAQLSDADKETRHLLAELLSEMASQDGPFGDADRQLATDLMDSLPAVQLGATLATQLQERAGILTSIFRSKPRRRLGARERMIEALGNRLGDPSSLTGLSDEEYQKLCVAGGLLAHIAHADGKLEDSERDSLRDALSNGWGVHGDVAEIVATIALDTVAAELDSFALSREFFERSDEPERIRFLSALFDVAAASSGDGLGEIEEIRLISRGFLLSHHHFIEAKIASQKRNA